jgi:hypothetical protein
MKTKMLRWALAIIAITGVLSGCLKSHEGVPIPPQTFISILHLAPTGPPVDVFFDDRKVSTNPFIPGTVSPVYNPVDKGAFSIKFKKTTTDSLVADAGLAQYDSLNYYTIFLFNQFTDGPVGALRIKDDYSEVSSNLTKPYYRFFHASPNTGPVDLYFDTVKVESSRRSADNVFNIGFNRFLGTSTNVHNIYVKLEGTSTVIASQTNIYLQTGHAYTFYLKGLDGGAGNNQLSLGILAAFQ